MLLVTPNMVKGKKTVCYDVNCPECHISIHTEKMKSVQCRSCGKRFDID